MFELTPDIILRIVLSIALGFIIGLERELTNKWAGLRTHILVCLGSCVFTVLSIYAFPTLFANNSPSSIGDPARVAAQVITGIGFIGGGAILRHGSTVYGLTTAATLWICAAIGMASGAGFLGTAIISTFLSMFVLIVIRIVEKAMLSSFVEKGVRINATVICSTENLNYVLDSIYKLFPNIVEISHRVSDEDESLVQICVIFDTVRGRSIADASNNLSKIKYAQAVTVQKVKISD